MTGPKVFATLVLGALLAVALAVPALATHPRPGSATPLRVPLVTWFEPCTNPNSMHVAPLALPSCDPPRFFSGPITTLGTEGAGGGFIKLTVYCTDAQAPPCNPADGTDTEDVGIVVHLSDVVCRRASLGCSAVGADYTGLFFVETPMRLTDHANGSPSGQTCPDGAGAPPCVTATTINTTFGFVRGQCVDNGGPGGGVCSTTTTMDTGTPGTVKEGQRSVLATMGFTMYDGGTDGTIGPACPPICGEGHDGLMVTQGVFLP